MQRSQRDACVPPSQACHLARRASWPGVPPGAQVDELWRGVDATVAASHVCVAAHALCVCLLYVRDTES